MVSELSRMHPRNEVEIRVRFPAAAFERSENRLTVPESMDSAIGSRSLFVDYFPFAARFYVATIGADVFLFDVLHFFLALFTNN